MALLPCDLCRAATQIFSFLPLAAGGQRVIDVRVRAYVCMYNRRISDFLRYTPYLPHPPFTPTHVCYSGLCCTHVRPTFILYMRLEAITVCRGGPEAGSSHPALLYIIRTHLSFAHFGLPFDPFVHPLLFVLL